VYAGDEVYGDDVTSGPGEGPESTCDDHAYAGSRPCPECEANDAAAFPGAAPDRDEAILRIRTALRRRTGRGWSVTGGRGSSWGWIHVTCPPARRVGYEGMDDRDREDLARALGLTSVHQQGVSIPADPAYRSEHVDRAEGREPSRLGSPYWD